jgi:hypothetical protein
MLDGNSRQNLATFCQTWAEPEIHRQEHGRQGRVSPNRRNRGAMRKHAGRSVAFAQ